MGGLVGIGGAVWLDKLVCDLHKYVQFIYSKMGPKNTPSLIFSEGGGVVLRPSLYYMQ